MLALIRVLPAPDDGVGTRHLEVLPDPPALRYSGFVVRCRDAAEVEATIVFYREIHHARPTAPLALVARPADCAHHLADFPARMLLVTPDELEPSGLPQAVVHHMREASIEGTILEEIAGEYGERVFTQEETLRAVVSRGLCGSTVESAAKDLGVHRETIRLRLNKVELKPGELISWVRGRAYQIRLERGVTKADAREAGGWHNPEAAREFLRRRHR